MSFEVWIAFVIASGALMLVPGPAMLFMIGAALNDGLSKALTALPGLALGLISSISISLLGAGAILLASAELFTVLKLVGAAYLIYLGVRLWLSEPGGGEPSLKGDLATKSLFWPAFLVAVLNPKALIFYIAFLPQFVDPNLATLPQFIILATTFSVVALGAAIASALAGSGLRSSTQSIRALKVMNRVGASAMVALGLLTASATRNQ